MTNSAPVFGSGAASTVHENQRFIARLAASDDTDSVGNGLKFGIVSGADASWFTIDANTGDFSFSVAPDYEMPTDVGGDNVYNVTVRVTDSAGLYSDLALSVSVLDLPTLQIVISDGQSLSQGTTVYPSVLSSSPLYPQTVLGMNFGLRPFMNAGWHSTLLDPTKFIGFAPFVEAVSETHSSGMMNALVSDYYANSLIPPTFLYMNVGQGSQSILQLMTGKDHIFQTSSDAMAHVVDGDIFAVDKLNGSYDFYARTGSSSYFYGNLVGSLNLFDNLIAEFNLAVNYGRAQGYEISPTLIFNWIQGQSDPAVRAPGLGYQYELSQLFDRVGTLATQVIGPNANVVGAVSQVRQGTARQTGVDQLNYVLSHPNVAFGAPEYVLNAEYPSNPRISGGDYIHLSPEGYYIYGQTIGHQLFGLLTGHKDTPILIDRVTQISPKSVLVHFTGVEGTLVNDPSPYLASNFIHAPPNMGFGVYLSGGGVQSAIKVTNATIVGVDTVQLDFNIQLTGQFRLYLGSTEDNLMSPYGTGLPAYGGTTLRDP